MQKINIKDIEYIAMVNGGSTVLVTGGGGDSYIRKLFVKEVIKESIPLAYLPGAVKLKVKLCGDFIS